MRAFCSNIVASATLKWQLQRDARAEAQFKLQVLGYAEDHGHRAATRKLKAKKKIHGSQMEGAGKRVMRSQEDPAGFPWKQCEVAVVGRPTGMTDYRPKKVQMNLEVAVIPGDLTKELRPLDIGVNRVKLRTV